MPETKITPTDVHQEHHFSRAKPILKWAGGKTQLLNIISQNYPIQFGFGTKFRHYIEPFFGGGAVFFNLYESKLIDHATILDTNQEIILLYKTVQKHPDKIVNVLADIEKKYIHLNPVERKEYYYEVRNKFNETRLEKYKNTNHVRSAQIIFLNRTCFNGLFRTNRKQSFNVPYGDHKHPKILDEKNLYAVSKAFQIAEIVNKDFTFVKTIATNDHFIYYDPPYRPVSKTSYFTSYSGVFNDKHQIMLAHIFKILNKKSIYQMLSNSDPLSLNGDDFFDKLYHGFNIQRIKATRKINTNSLKRGHISELLITNY